MASEPSIDQEVSLGLGLNLVTPNLISSSPTTMTFDSAGRAAIVYAAGGATTLRHDLNADGDFSDPGETTAVVAQAAFGCDVEGHASQGLAVTHDVGGLQLLVDRNGDDDFADTDEQLTLAPPAAYAPIELGRPASGKATVATRNTLYTDPLP